MENKVLTPEELQKLKNTQTNRNALMRDFGFIEYQIQELELQMSLADLKMVDKEMEKQIEKLFEDEQWLVLKPLSYLASKKYGASTKWCTASDKEPDYYYRYVLVNSFVFRNVLYKY